MDDFFFDNTITEETVNASKFLIFSVADRKFALDIYNVVEIVNIQPLKDVPDMPEYIAGILNLRDRVYPVMDLNIRFRNTAKKYDEKTCIILLEFNDLHAGIIVDDILEVSEINSDRIIMPPEERTGFFNRFIKQIIRQDENELIFIIDCDALFINEQDYIKELNS